MPPVSKEQAYKYAPSFYKFWELKPNMTYEEFNQPLRDELMKQLLKGPIHSHSQDFDVWFAADVPHELYFCSRCETLECDVHDQTGIQNWSNDVVINMILTWIKTSDQNLKKPFFYTRQLTDST